MHLKAFEKVSKRSERFISENAQRSRGINRVNKRLK